MALAADKIDAIRQGADIITVIGAAIDLKKKGQRYMGLCPFHGEKTPSFSVSADKGLYYCFGCHVGGDVFSFVMRHDGLDFQAAVRKLAQQAGVDIEPESPEIKARRRLETELARVNSYTAAYFEHALWEDGGRHARSYLSERGIPEPFARHWQLGYGGRPGGLLDYLEAKKVPAPLAAKAGILTEDGRRGLFDDRLIFPIVDSQDRIAGFGGRRLRSEGGPKYVNSRETPLFAKRGLLFGWREAEDAVRRSKRILLVEGYMDVLACHRAGTKVAVAALGTAFTEEHSRACARLAKEAVLMFDGDAAGVRASRDATVLVVRSGLKALVVPLGENEDPDSVVQEEGTLDARLDKAVPAVEHFIDTTVTAEMSIEDRSRAAQELAPLVLGLTSGLERDLYTARLAEKVGVSTEQMSTHLRQVKPRRRASPPRRQPGPMESPDASPAPAPVARPSPVELKILAELFLYPQIRPRLGELAEYTSDPMRVLLDELASSEEEVSEILPRHVDTRAAARLASIEVARHDSKEEADQSATRTVDDVLNRLKSWHMEATQKEMMQELREAEARGDDTDDLIRRIQNLTRRKRELRRHG